MRALGEILVRLIEADVSVQTHAEQLQVNAARRLDGRIVALALPLGVKLRAVRQIDALCRHIHRVEEVFVHEIVIALFVIGCQAAVFVQIEGRAAAEIHITLVIPFNQLLVNANRRRTGRQTEYGIRFENNLCRDDVGCLAAHVVIILSANDFHGIPLSSVSGNRKGRQCARPFHCAERNFVICKQDRFGCVDFTASLPFRRLRTGPWCQ